MESSAPLLTLNQDIPDTEIYKPKFKKIDYKLVALKGSSVSNLNRSSGQVLTWEIPKQDYFDFRQGSYLYAKFEIKNIAQVDNITLENNWFPRTLKDIKITMGSNNQEFEKIDEI